MKFWNVYNQGNVLSCLQVSLLSPGWDLVSIPAHWAPGGTAWVGPSPASPSLSWGPPAHCKDWPQHPSTLQCLLPQQTFPQKTGISYQFFPFPIASLTKHSMRCLCFLTTGNRGLTTHSVLRVGHTWQSPPLSVLFLEPVPSFQTLWLPSLSGIMSLFRFSKEGRSQAFLSSSRPDSAEQTGPAAEVNHRRTLANIQATPSLVR